MSLRRSFFLAACLLVWASQAQAAISVIQSKNSTNGAIFSGDGIDSLAFDTGTTIGDFVVVHIQLESAARTITSVVDDSSAANTYALCNVGGTNATTETTGFEVWSYCGKQNVSATTFTVTISSALASFGKITMIQVRGQHATTPVESIALHNDTTGMTHATGPVTTANAGSIVIGNMVGSNGTYTDDAAFTPVENTTSGSASAVSSYDLVDAASTTWTVGTTGNEGTASVLMALAPAAAASGCTGGLTLLGAGKCEH